ncbi:hypothetical protein B0H10DRAFT_1817527 [Mycena sp. CBHHK59/15]|nr:hypothetical protein B0H10DRAFT_1817527 [Mycena sp. CBHHK59/15]
MNRSLPQKFQSKSDRNSEWNSELHGYNNQLHYLLTSTNTYLIATSTGVKRVFSKGRQLLYFTCNHLSTKSVQTFLCLGSWSRHDLVGDKEFHLAVRENMKGKGKSKEHGDDED